MQLQAWEMPLHRPVGQSTEKTLQIAKEALQRRDAVAKAAAPIFSCFSCSSRVAPKPRPTTFTTEEQVAERLAMHLIKGPHVDEECVNAFAQVVESCYGIDMSLESEIGVDSFADVLSDSSMNEFFSSVADRLELDLLSELVEKYTLKPFSKSGMHHFFCNYAYAFVWVKDPAREVMGNMKEKFKVLDEAYRSEGGVDSIENRRIFLKGWLEKNPTFLNDLREVLPIIPTTAVISKTQLLRVIEIAGKSKHCFKISLPSGHENSPEYSASLQKYGFQSTALGNFIRNNR